MLDQILSSQSLDELQRSQQEEIARYKWIESEKAGADIGWERATEGWFQNHFADWVRSQRRALDQLLREASQSPPPLIHPPTRRQRQPAEFMQSV